MFWGDQEESRARHSLSDALSHLRRVLGRTAIAANQATAMLDASAALVFDAVEFAAAVKAGDDARAIELYAGPFLDGVHVDGSSSFESWVSAERSRLDLLFARACARRTAALAGTAEWEECAEVARRWLEREPASSAAARYRIEAIAAPGTREAAVRALQEFERLTARLEQELGIRPDTAVADIARRLSSRVRKNELPHGNTREYLVPSGAFSAVRLGVGESAVSPDGASPAKMTPAAKAPAAMSAAAPPPAVSKSIASPPVDETPASPTPTAIDERVTQVGARPRTPRTSWRAIVGSVALLLVIAVAGFAYRARTGTAVTPAGHAAIALTDFALVRGDTSQAWMTDGLASMLATKLSRSAAFELIAPERIREIAARAHYDLRQPLGTARSREIGARAGATLIVSGALQRADSMLQVELTVSDVATGKTVRVVSVAARDVMSLADAGAARLLDAIDPAGGGAKLADLETTSQEAYQHFVAFIRNSNGVSATIARQELDRALALDSGFVSAIIERRKIAIGAGDTIVARRLDTLFDKHNSRASYWDRTTLEAERIIPEGDIGRGIALYRELVARYPRDPRGYTQLWNALTTNGEWKASEQVALQQLAIDSLAETAGNGVCAPCGAYSDLANSRLALGDVNGAEAAARRLVSLQPELGGGWILLGYVLLSAGKYDEGLEAYRRANFLNPEFGEWWLNLQARNLLVANRLADADTMIARLERSKTRDARSNGLDIRALWLRERGEWQKSIDVTHQMQRDFGDDRTAILMRGGALARLGRYAEARHEFESLHPLYEHDEAGNAARWFSWSHTLEGDALAASGDTVLLKTLADSALLVGSRSYYARDRMVPHYLRALVAARGGRASEAEREFRAALFSVNGFTRVNVAFARFLFEQKRYAEAETLLVQALSGPADAMSRYQPRTETRALLDSVRARIR